MSIKSRISLNGCKILLIFALLASMSYATGYDSDSYSKLSKSQIKSDGYINSCMNYGIKQTFSQYQSYSVQSINSVYKMTSGNTAYYKYDITMQNIKQGGSAKLNFVVGYQSKSKKYSVTAYSYSYQSSSSSSSSSSSQYGDSSSQYGDSSSQYGDSSSQYGDSSSSYSSSPSSSYGSSSSSYWSKQISTSSIKKNAVYSATLNYGVNQCLQTLKKNKIIGQTNYKVSQVVKAFSKTISKTVVEYDYQVICADQYGSDMTLDFTVQYQANSGVQILKSYNVACQSNSQSQYTMAQWDSTQTECQVGNYEYLDESQYSSGTAKQAINYGKQQIITSLSKEATFSSFKSSSFSVSNVQSVYQSAWDSNVYSIQATFTNKQGKNVNCNYVVSCPPTGPKKVQSYSYTVY